MSVQLTMKNRVNKEKRCSLDKWLSLWYNLSREIEKIFSVVFISFDESPLTHLPRLSPPQNRVNSTSASTDSLVVTSSSFLFTRWNNSKQALAFSLSSLAIYLIKMFVS